jgi:enoyl-CoA hydratase
MNRPNYQSNTPDIAVARDGRIVTLTLSRPEDQNRLTPDALAKLEVLAAELRDDSEAQVVVITGQGSTDFSMGILPPSLRESLGKDNVVALVRLANRVLDAIDALPQIVIAGINGNARGGAAELALACDIRAAADSATLAFPEAQVGGFPGAGGPLRLASAVGRARALELMCTSRVIDAAEMERIGLVQFVYPKSGFSKQLTELAARIAAAGPLATRGAKRIVRARLDPGFAASRELADALRHHLEWSSDVAEGLAAHREGRPPKFTGR